jgi:hypothetical protein
VIFSFNIGAGDNRSTRLPSAGFMGVSPVATR